MFAVSIENFCFRRDWNIGDHFIGSVHGSSVEWPLGNYRKRRVVGCREIFVFITIVNAFVKRAACGANIEISL